MGRRVVSTVMPTSASLLLLTSGVIGSGQVSAQGPPATPSPPEGATSEVTDSRRLVAPEFFAGTVRSASGRPVEADVQAFVRAMPGSGDDGTLHPLARTRADRNGRFSLRAGGIPTGAPIRADGVARVVVVTNFDGESTIAINDIALAGSASPAARTAGPTDESAPPTFVQQDLVLQRGSPVGGQRGRSHRSPARRRQVSPGGLCSPVGSRVRVSDARTTVAQNIFALTNQYGVVPNWKQRWTYTRSNTTTVQSGIDAGYSGGVLQFTAAGSTSIGRTTTVTGDTGMVTQNGANIGKKYQISVSRYLQKWSCLAGSSPQLPPITRYTLEGGAWVADFLSVDVPVSQPAQIGTSTNPNRNFTVVCGTCTLSKASSMTTSYSGGFSGAFSYGGISMSANLNSTVAASGDVTLSVNNQVGTDKALWGQAGAGKQPIFGTASWVNGGAPT